MQGPGKPSYYMLKSLYVIASRRVLLNSKIEHRFYFVSNIQFPLRLCKRISTSPASPPNVLLGPTNTSVPFLQPRGARTKEHS